MDALDAEGLTPDDITDVIFTHGHPDHLWGVLDDFDEPLFLNAAYKMGQVERDYWMDPDTVNTIGEARASFAAGASRRIEAIDGMLETFEDGAEVAPGVTAMATAGHTPGHMSFAVSSGDTTVMVIGDAVSNDHVAMARPDWPSGSDQDTEMGAATRARLLDQLATDQMLAVGFHMGGGGLGRVERRATATVSSPISEVQAAAGPGAVARSSRTEVAMPPAQIDAPATQAVSDITDPPDTAEPTAQPPASIAPNPIRTAPTK
jgi:glyoxylase-like metal-dependent hydrolase (beta-lactamase superfamily II)